MNERTLLVSKNDGVATILINRPEARNALDRATSAALARVFRDFEADADSRVAVLGGTGDCFCAGADLKEMAEGPLYEPWGASADGPTCRPPGKPVVAAVAGTACAGGLGLALWCDLRIADETAVFGVFSRRWGIPMSDGTSVRLPRMIGLGRALDLLLTGRPVPAREALEMGLVNRVVPAGRALSAAQELARQIAAHPEPALLCDRASAYAQADLSLAQALHHEAEASRPVREGLARDGAARFERGEGRHGEGAGGES